MIHVVDGLLEDIRMGMEVTIPELNQRRISCVKFLGELYNYQIVESNVIFRTLYSFLTFGRNADGKFSHPFVATYLKPSFPYMQSHTP